MAIDYTVVQPVRQRFGDSDVDWPEEVQVELEAPFVGRSKDYPFSCPNVDASQMGALQFETFGLTSRDNVIEVNGAPVPGGLTPGSFFTGGYDIVRAWKAHSLLVPADVLAEENVLHVESVSLGDDGGLDNFILDNVVIFFKTRTSHVRAS